jgi:polysaccharide export outer membrane protein
MAAITARKPNEPVSKSDCSPGDRCVPRLWVAGSLLLVLAMGWCSWNYAEFDLLRQTPLINGGEWEGDDRDLEQLQNSENLKSGEADQLRRTANPETAGRAASRHAGVSKLRFDPFVVPCQAYTAAGCPPICGVDCGFCGRCGASWNEARPLNFQPYGPGEYVGHSRFAHVPAYRLRVDDQLECLYRLTREETSEPYRINVGDELQVESAADDKLNKPLIVQPDGTITLRLLGQVKATGATVPELRDTLESLYKKFYPTPGITVTPLKVNTRLEDLRATVDNRSGIVGGQGVRVRITPEGTISLPAIGSVPAQGLTLEELKTEIDLRYAATISGVEITPILAERAPRFCYVLGEVRIPGRYVLEGPTTVMQAIAMAGSWNVGANLQQVVIFRRGDDWRLLGTMVNLNAALRFAKDPCPAGEIWLNDSDVIILPKSKILLTDDFIDLVFTRGVYGVLPFGASVSWASTTIR